MIPIRNIIADFNVRRDDASTRAKAQQIVNEHNKQIETLRTNVNTNTNSSR